MKHELGSRTLEYERSFALLMAGEDDPGGPERWRNQTRD